MTLRRRACELLLRRNIPQEYETVIYNSDVHYETAIRHTIWQSLDEALGITHVEDSSSRASAGAKNTQQSIQTRSATNQLRHSTTV